MGFIDLASGAHPAFDRGEVVVCIPLYGAHEHFVRCLRSLLEHTPADVPILVADDASPEPASRAFVEELDAAGALRHDVLWFRQPENVGFVKNVNAAFGLTAPADVLLVNSDVVVSDGWLQGLRDAAYGDSTIATATALTNHGTIVSVPNRNRPEPRLPQDRTLAELATGVARGSARKRPRIPVAIGHCVFFRRTGLELIGDFDLAFSPGYGEEVDWSQRCIAMGLQHVLADDVFVAHFGNASFEGLGGRSAMQIAHEELIDARYPYYALWVREVSENADGPLAAALQRSGRAFSKKLRVTIDGRILGSALTGTQIHALELIAALARTEATDLRVVLPGRSGDYVGPALLPLGIDLRDESQALAEGPTEIIHRPWQVGSVEEVMDLRQFGLRTVLTQQDFIAYRNPSYFPDGESWRAYRLAAGQATALSAMTVFFSHHAYHDALAEDLLEPQRGRVVLIGTDHRVSVQKPQPKPPEGPALADRPFLLCLGTDFRHKNRVFALRLLRELRERHTWPGRLVLAGPHVAYGSSSADEAAFLAAHPDLVPHVLELPAVGEPEKAWLLSRCAAVVYPTTYEGFGLVPFEAADAGRPCLFAHQASLTELFEPDDALLVAWDAGASADRVIGVLTDEAQATAHVEGVRERGKRLQWDDTAKGLLEAYEAALALPSRSAARLIGSDILLGGHYWTLRHQIGPTGLSLVGPDDPEGPLLPVDVQRTIAGLAAHPRTRGPLIEGLRTARRVGARLRSGRNGRTP